MIQPYTIALLLSFLLLLTACGGGDDNKPAATTSTGGNTTTTTSGNNTANSNTEPATTGSEANGAQSTLLTGQFIDAAVQGLTYSTPSQTGVTNVFGEFQYQAGETVQFSIGGIGFTPVMGARFITPLDLFNTRDVTDSNVVNLARLLQSLDADGNPDNGINITQATHELAEGMQLSFDQANFESLVTNLIANSAAQNGGNASNTLVSTEQAITHLQSSLADFEIGAACTATHAKVGASGILSELDHDVSGSVTVIDDCTLLVTNFNYDGRGPAVYFYAGTDGAYNPDTSDAFRISGLLTGSPASNDQILLKLPDGKTLDDFNGVSVWCEAISASFGDTLLTQ